MEVANKLDPQAGRERRSPRISLNKLGEYVASDVLARRRILNDQKRPKSFVVGSYTEAEAAIRRYLCGGASDEEILLDAIRRLEPPAGVSSPKAQRRLRCIEALDAFRGHGLAGRLPLGDLKARPGERRPPHLLLGGVDVSVRPEVVLTGHNRSGQPVAGAVKLYLSKTRPLTVTTGENAAGEYVAAGLHRYLEAYRAGDEKVEPGLCFAVDVFAGRIFLPPQNRSRLWRILEAACQEISGQWPRT